MGIRSSVIRADASPFPPEQVGGLASALRAALAVFPDDDAEPDAGAAIAVLADGAQLEHPEAMAMEMRTFGRSGMRVSILGFGCGAVGGLMVRGDPADQERAVARALEAGVNYFDTAGEHGKR